MRTKYRGFQISVPDELGSIKNNIAEVYHIGGNLIRYQLTAPLDQYSAWTPAQYEEWFKRAKENLFLALQWSQDRVNVKFVVDMHTPIGGHVPVEGRSRHRLFFDPEIRQLFYAYWLELVEVCQGFKNIYGYDLLNEPRIRTAKRWFTIAEELGYLIRQVDQQRRVVIAITDNWKDLLDCEIPDLKRSVYTFHFYKPADVTFQGITKEIDPKAYGEISNRYLRRKMFRYIRFARKHNARLYMGECGCSNYVPEGVQSRYFRRVLRLCEKYGIDYTLHAWNEHPVWNYRNRPRTMNSIRHYFKENIL